MVQGAPLHRGALFFIFFRRVTVKFSSCMNHPFMKMSYYYKTTPLKSTTRSNERNCIAPGLPLYPSSLTSPDRLMANPKSFRNANPCGQYRALDTSAAGRGTAPRSEHSPRAPRYLFGQQLLNHPRPTSRPPIHRPPELRRVSQRPSRRSRPFSNSASPPLRRLWLSTGSVLIF